MNLAWILLAASIFAFIIGITFIVKSRNMKATNKRVDEWFEHEAKAEKEFCIIIWG